MLHAENSDQNHHSVSDHQLKISSYSSVYLSYGKAMTPLCRKKNYMSQRNELFLIVLENWKQQHQQFETKFEPPSINPRRKRYQLFSSTELRKMRCLHRMEQKERQSEMLEKTTVLQWDRNNQPTKALYNPNSQHLESASIGCIKQRFYHFSKETKSTTMMYHKIFPVSWQ